MLLETEQLLPLQYSLMRWQQEQNVSHDDQSTSPQLHDTQFGNILSVIAFVYTFFKRLLMINKYNPIKRKKKL